MHRVKSNRSGFSYIAATRGVLRIPKLCAASSSGQDKLPVSTIYPPTIPFGVEYSRYIPSKSLAHFRC